MKGVRRGGCLGMNKGFCSDDNLGAGIRITLSGSSSASVVATSLSNARGRLGGALRLKMLGETELAALVFSASRNDHGANGLNQRARRLAEPRSSRARSPGCARDAASHIP